MEEIFRNASTPPRDPRIHMKTHGASTDKRVRRHTEIEINTVIEHEGKNYDINIETGRLDPGPAPLSVRLQTNDINIENQKSPALAEHKTDWTGTYTGSTSEHSLGYLEPGTSKLKKIYANEPIRYFKVTGNFISNPQISSTIKAQKIMTLITNRDTSTQIQTTPIKDISDKSDFTRHLFNQGYDCYIGQDNDENPNDLECIILQPKKFQSVNEAEITLDKRGEVSVKRKGHISESNIVGVNTVLLNMLDQENVKRIPRQLFLDDDAL